MIKHIIFDLDGTLLNTLDEISYIANIAIMSYGFNEVSRENVSKYIGDGAINLIDRMLRETRDVDQDTLTNVYSHYAILYNRLQGEKVEIYNGITDLLDFLNQNDVTYSVLSNKPNNNVTATIEKFFPSYTFTHVYGGGIFPLKPDKTSAEHIINELGLNKEQVLLIGDGDADILTANNAEIVCLSALWGNRTMDELKEVGGQLFFEDPKDIIEYLKNLDC